MGRLKEKWNKNNFSIYKNEEKTVLKLIEGINNFNSVVIDEIDNKVDQGGNFTGSWQGLSKPTLAQEGISALVEKLSNEQIPIINVKSSGALGNGIKDDYQDIQTLIDRLHSEGGGTIFFPTGKYIVGKTLKFYDNVTFEFETGNKDYSYIAPKENGVYIKNYLILINSLDGVTPYKNVSSKSSDNKEYNGISINNFVDMNNSKAVIYNGLKGIFIAQGNCQFNRVTSMGLNKTIELDKNSYLDNIIIENSLFMGVGDYAIVKEGNGECLTLRNCKVYDSLVSGGANWKLLKCYNTFNLRIENIINGTISIYNSTFSINNIHIEKGYLDINNSNGTISDFTIYHSTDGQAPMLLKSNWKNTVELKNGETILTPFEHPYGETTYNFDLYTTIGNLIIENVRRSIFFNYGKLSTTGIKIDSSDTNLKNSFNRNSSQLSQKCNIVGGGIITKLSYYNEMVNGGGIISVNVDTSNPYTWHNVETPLFYTCQMIFGNEKYLMGANMSNEVSTNATNKPISIKINNAWKCRNATLRLYRGTTTERYSAYVDIPIIGLENDVYGLVDTGTQVNGFPWIYTNTNLTTLSTQFDNNIKNMEYKGVSESSLLELTVNGTPKSTNFKTGDRAISIAENKTLFFNGTSWI